MSSTRAAMAAHDAARAVRRRNENAAAAMDLTIVAALVGENCEELRTLVGTIENGREPTLRGKADLLLEQIEALCRALAGES